MVTGMLQRLTGPFREFGPLAGLLYVASRLLQALSPRTNLYVYDLMAQPIPGSSNLPGRSGTMLEIRTIQMHAAEIDQMPIRPDIKESRFAQGSVCLGAFRSGVLIGYLWLSFGAYDEDEVRCTYLPSPPGQSAFDYDLYIFPRYRMGRGFAGIWDGVNGYLRDRGIAFTFSRITRFNLQSRRAHAHLGARRIGSAVFLKLWRVEFMVATIAPFFNVSADETSRVRLRLSPVDA